MRSKWLPWLVLAGLISSLALSACGSNPRTTAGDANQTATATTAAPTVTAATAAAPCSLPHVALKSGDLVIDTPSLGLGYPYYKLSDGVDLTIPQQVPGIKPANPLPTNPSMGTGFGLTICNTSSTHDYTLTSLKLRIDTFTPYSGKVDEWTFCHGPYDTATKSFADGCGGGVGADVMVQATMPGTIAAGLVLDTTNNNPAIPRSAPLGTLSPEAGLFVTVGVANSLPAGTYTFSVGVAVDGAAPMFVPSGEKPMLFAPVAHTWSGEACTKNSSMMSQIPPSTDHHYYVCPDA